jgi:hypothetical protein
MDDKNSSNVQHPFHAALMTFHAAVRIAFETAAAFWRPWFREPEKKECCPKRADKSSVWGSPSTDEARAGSDGEKAQGADTARATAKTQSSTGGRSSRPEKNPFRNGRDEAQHAIKE